MTDSTTDTNLSQVVSSYGDVNTALEKLLANMPNQSNLLSSTLGMGSSDLAGGGMFFQSSTGEPVFSYKDASGNTKTIPLESVAAANAAANNSSNASLPTSVSGATIPQVLGLSGRAVMQAFVATGGNPYVTYTPTITFPTAFAPGTTPIVIQQVDNEEGRQMIERTSSIVVNANQTGPSITNTGFQVELAYNGGNASGQPWTIQVIAIGIM